MITQERLKEVLHYDPESGIFRWLVAMGRNRPGDVAGTLRSDGYVRIQIFGERRYAAHWAFLYMTGRLPDDEVDHIDRVRSNNAWGNLRPASKSQNCVNRLEPARKSGLLKGVTRYGTGRFRAQINACGRVRHLGIFDTETEAHAAYVSAARFFHGEFVAATDNEPQMRSAA